MKKVLFAAGVALALVLAPSVRPQQGKKEEENLRKRAEAFVAAFNKGDAKGVAAFFTPDGDVVDQEGHHLKGRKAIEEGYQKFFSQAKGAKLFITITSVRFPKPDLALEDGVTEVVPPDGGAPSSARYSIVYVKQDGQWYIESVREAIAVPPTNADKLQDLEFLIGHWVEDVEKGGSARASYSWEGHKNFMVNTFELTMQDVSIAGGTQWIGWDESVKKPRSWTFVFNGGFAEGVWTRDGKDRWKVAVVGTQRDGKKVTATNVLTRVDDDHFSFHFIDRKLDGKPLPEIKEVKMKRVK
jgi:uncharacterized protein (TIGR02246 family)